MLDEGVGTWVRFSEYEIRVGGRGTTIAPAPGAEAEPYDPWEDRGGAIDAERAPFSRSRRRPKSPPYALLTDLLDVPDLERARGAMVPQLSDSAERLVLDWCRRYGLLGLALHEHRAVTFPVSNDGSSGGERWEWGSGGWQGRSHGLDLGSTTRAAQVEPGPGVEYRPIMGQSLFHWEAAPFESWLSYFPDNSAAAHAPPGSLEFWRGYEEPLGEFLNAIHSLRDVLQATARHKRDPEPQAQRIATFFNRLTDRVHPVIKPGDDRPWVARYAAPSLLSMLTMMARDDATGCSLHQCASPDCGRLFRSTARAVVFCSDTCRSREQKRKKVRVDKTVKGGA